MNIRSHVSRAIPIGIALLMVAIPAGARQTARNRAERQEARRTERTERKGTLREAAFLRLSERLELTDSQKEAVRAVMQYDEESGRGGDGWMLAAVLDRELSDEQRGKLFDASRQAAIYRLGVADGSRGARARGARPAGGPGAMAGLREGRMENMQKALQLSDEQVRILRIHHALTGIMGARAQARAARMQAARRSDFGPRHQGARRFRVGSRFGR